MNVYLLWYHWDSYTHHLLGIFTDEGVATGHCDRLKMSPDLLCFSSYEVEEATLDSLLYEEDEEAENPAA